MNLIVQRRQRMLVTSPGNKSYHYILICPAYDFVSTCGFLPEILLSVFEMQISCLAEVHDFSI